MISPVIFKKMMFFEKQILEILSFCLYSQFVVTLSSNFPSQFQFATEIKQTHEFHISKCQVEYNEQEQAIQISLHLFIDDLESALRQQGADKLFICSDKEAEIAEDAILKYLKQQLLIEVEGKTLTFNFIGKEPSEDKLGVWCYLEVSEIKNIKQLKIKNRVLTEMFEDQKNIISVVGPKKKKSYFLFDKQKNEETILF